MVRSAFLVSTAKHEFDGCADEIMQLDGQPDLDFSTRNLAVLVVPIRLPVTLNRMEYAGAWRVITENIKWILTEVETAVTCRGLAIVLVGFSLFVLESSALHVTVKPLESGDNRMISYRLFCGCLLAFCLALRLFSCFLLRRVNPTNSSCSSRRVLVWV